MEIAEETAADALALALPTRDTEGTIGHPSQTAAAIDPALRTEIEIEIVIGIEAMVVGWTDLEISSPIKKEHVVAVIMETERETASALEGTEMTSAPPLVYTLLQLLSEIT